MGITVSNIKTSYTKLSPLTLRHSSVLINTDLGSFMENGIAFFFKLK